MKKEKKELKIFGEIKEWTSENPNSENKHLSETSHSTAGEILKIEKQRKKHIFPENRV